MLNIQQLKQNAEEVKARLSDKNSETKELIGKLIEKVELYEKAKEEAEKSQAAMNTLLKQANELLKKEKQEDSADLGKGLSTIIGQIPNIPDFSSPLASQTVGGPYYKSNSNIEDEG